MCLLEYLHCMFVGHGPTGIENIKAHPFFASINWEVRIMCRYETDCVVWIVLSCVTWYEFPIQIVGLHLAMSIKWLFI